MTPEEEAEFVARFKCRLFTGDIDGTFTGGGCFYFAIRAFNRGIGTLHYSGTSGDSKKRGHVFVITENGQAFDHNGYSNPLALVAKFHGYSGKPPRAISSKEVEKEILTSPLSKDKELASSIFTLADQIITEKAKPRHTGSQ